MWHDIGLILCGACIGPVLLFAMAAMLGNKRPTWRRLDAARRKYDADMRSLTPH